MCSTSDRESQTIQTKVEDFVQQNEAFTSVDIANAIKTDGTWIRNRVVARWLRHEFHESNYEITSIDLDNGQSANLYHPSFMDAENYDARGQKAMTPAEFKQLHPDTDIDNSDSSQNSSSRSSSVNSSAKSSASIKDVKVTVRNNRIRLPGRISRALGWLPGSTIDLTKVKSNNSIKGQRKVHGDGRISIPKSCLGSSHTLRASVENGELVLEEQ